MLEIVGLKAGYGAASVLHGVDFTLKQGQFVGLLGANNAGKSRVDAQKKGACQRWADTR